MARTLIVRTHLDTTARTPMYAVVHAEQCTDLADTTDCTDTAMTALIPGESVTVRDIRNEFIQRDITYPVVAHERCLRDLADREAADDEVAKVSPTTRELAAELGVPDIDITRAAELWFRAHGSGTAFFPTLRDDVFVVRPAFAAYVREQLANDSTTGPQHERARDDDALSSEATDAASLSSSGTETAAGPTRAVDIPAKLLSFVERAERCGLTVEYGGNVSQSDILHRWDISSPNPVDETQILLHWRPGQRGGRVHISHYRGYLGTGRKSLVTVTRQVAHIVLDMMAESLQRHRDREAAKAVDQPTPMRQQPQQQQHAADHRATDERPAAGADGVGAPREREVPDSAPTTPVVDHSTATEAARKAIEVTRTLSPAMRDAVKAATEDDHEMLRVGWNGFVSTRTVGALARRGVVVSAQDGTLTDLGRFVFAVLFVGEEGTLAEAARRDAVEARERTQTAQAERRGFCTETDHTFCAECAVSIRVHATNTRPATHPESGPCGKRQDECEGMPMLPFTDWGTAGRTWHDWVTHVRRYREAADMDDLHARALTEHEVREVTWQLAVRYYVRRVNDGEFYIVVDADHQNRTVSAMTKDLDEAKAWQREAHRQWAECVVARRARTVHDEGAATPEQGPAGRQAAHEWARNRRPRTEGQEHHQPTPIKDDQPHATLRGCMAHDYDVDAVNRVFGRLHDASGVRLVCLWGELDNSQGRGNSMFFVEADGQLHELAGSLDRWLTGDPDDPNTPVSPGAPASWIGPPADITVDLTYTLDSDGLYNYGWQTFTLEERAWRGSPSQPHSPRECP